MARKLTMQKRHFEFLASVIAEARRHVSADVVHVFDVNVIGKASARLGPDNPTFDYERFAEACRKGPVL